MAYKALVKKYHPDVFNGSSEEAEEWIKLINQAYEVLSDDIKRREYDAYLIKILLDEQKKADVTGSSENNDINEKSTFQGNS